MLIRRSFVPIGDTATGEVVRGQLNLNSITRKYPDVVHPHFAGYMGQHLVAIL